MIVGFVDQVGYIVDGDTLHIAIVSDGHGKKVAKFQITLCPAKMHQQRMAFAARHAAPPPAPPSPPEFDARIARVTGLHLPAGKFALFVFNPPPELSP